MGEEGGDTRGAAALLPVGGNVSVSAVTSRSGGFPLFK